MLGNQKSIYYLRLFVDLILLNFSFFVASVLSQSLSTLLARPYMFVLLAMLNFLWYFYSNVSGFYEDATTRSYSFQFSNIIKNIFVQTISVVFFIFIAKEDLFTRNFIFIYSFSLLVLVSTRIQVIKHLIIGIKGKEKNQRNVIIIGAGEVGKNFKSLIKSREDFGYNFIGFLDDHDTHSNPEVLGSISQIESVIESNDIHVAVIALSVQASDELAAIIKLCNKHGLRVHIIPDYFRFLSKKYQVNMIGDFPIITVRDEPLGEAHWRFLKRAFDIILSILVIFFIFLWLFPLLFVLNKLSGTGQLLFIQDRVGASNKVFKCYKFRTMFSNNKSPETYQPTIKNDPRVTRVGNFLRKSNIDELPQFINVFKGEMSVVGPRPHPLYFHEVYKEMVEEIKLRTWVKPGLTGWAQVHGLRGDVPDYDENKIRTIKRIEYDLWYIENWSLWLDLQIILLTVWQMIKRDTKGV